MLNFNPSDSKTKECQLSSNEQVLYSRLLVNQYLRDTKLILLSKNLQNIKKKLM